MTNSVKVAKPDHPVHEVITKRWSPYAFAPRAVSEEDLRSLFEAARWAASSYNEQPWQYIVATQRNPAEFAKLLSCLIEANQAWAKDAPVLALGCVSLNFKRNGKLNSVAIHDLGAASASLTVEATARGLVVHQMAGIVPEKAREIYHIPEGVEAVTGIAIGYAGEASSLPAALQPRDLSERTRKPLAEFVFANEWGAAAPEIR